MHSSRLNASEIPGLTQPLVRANSAQAVADATAARAVIAPAVQSDLMDAISALAKTDPLNEEMAFWKAAQYELLLRMAPAAMFIDAHARTLGVAVHARDLLQLGRLESALDALASAAEASDRRDLRYALAVTSAGLTAALARLPGYKPFKARDGDPIAGVAIERFGYLTMTCTAIRNLAMVDRA